MRRKNEILVQVARNEITLEEAMNRAMNIAVALKDLEFQEWITKEVNGYNTAEAVPAYRNMSGIVVVYDFNGHKIELPQRVKDNNYQIVSHQGNALGILGIKTTIEQSDFFIEASIPAENFNYIQKYSPIEICNAKLKVPKTQFEDILSTVKNELVRRLSEKSKDIKNLNKFDVGNKMNNKETKITINDKSINVGDGNSITNSNIGNNNQINPKESKNFFERHPIVTGVIASLLVAIFVVTKYGKEILKFFEGK